LEEWDGTERRARIIWQMEMNCCNKISIQTGQRASTFDIVPLVEASCNAFGTCHKVSKQVTHLTVLLVSRFRFVSHLVGSGPSRATAGPGKRLSRGPSYHNLIPYAPRSRRQMRPEGGNMGCPLTTRLDLGERRKLPQRGLGRSPGRKWILCVGLFAVRKSHL